MVLVLYESYTQWSVIILSEQWHILLFCMMHFRDTLRMNCRPKMLSSWAFSSIYEQNCQFIIMFFKGSTFITIKRSHSNGFCATSTFIHFVVLKLITFSHVKITAALWVGRSARLFSCYHKLYVCSLSAVRKENGWILITCRSSDKDSSLRHTTRWWPWTFLNSILKWTVEVHSLETNKKISPWIFPDVKNQYQPIKAEFHPFIL